MSLRATTGNVDFYNRLHEIDIYDSDWSGGVTELANTGSGYATFTHQKIDPRDPWGNPIQKGVLEFNVWLKAGQTGLLDDLKTADENRFHAVHKVDGVPQWKGYIYFDLSSYEEQQAPYRVTLVAKDFTDLGGKDYLVNGSLPDNRETVISTIAYLLDSVGFNTPIRTHTSWIEEHLDNTITGDYDYLYHIYHETKALREYAKTGDEEPQPITIEDALNKILSNHRLILKQANGAYYIDQITAFSAPKSVLEGEYSLSGAQTSLTTVDNTILADNNTLKVVIEEDNRDNSGLPGLKRSKVKFDHRAKFTGIQFPDVIAQNTSYSQNFSSDGNQTIDLSVSVGPAQITGSTTSAKAHFTLQVGKYWWNESQNKWVDSTITPVDDIDIDLTVQPFPNSNNQAFAFERYQTKVVPPDADGDLIISFGTIGAYVEGREYGANLTISNAITEKNSNYINYELTQEDSWSVTQENEDIWYGDGPYDVPSALRYDSAGISLTEDSWQRRGQAGYRSFFENYLKESMDTQRGWRRLLTATLKGEYKAHQIIQYDSQYLLYLGGSQDLFTGNWSVELFNIDVATAANDVFEVIPKYSDEDSTSGDSDTGTQPPSGGITDHGQLSGLGDPNDHPWALQTDFSNVDDWTPADNRFLNESANLSDLDSAPDAISNLGLKDGSADLDLNSLLLNGQIQVSSAPLQVNGFMRTGDIYIHEGGQTPTGNSLALSNNAGILEWDGDKIWDEGNDGPGSGLDADLWDGNQFADYLDQPVRTTDPVLFDGITSTSPIIAEMPSGQDNFLIDPDPNNMGGSWDRNYGILNNSVAGGRALSFGAYGDDPGINYGYVGIDRLSTIMRFYPDKITTDYGLAVNTTSLEGFDLNVVGTGKLSSSLTVEGTIFANAPENAIIFDGGDARITTHDGLGNFNILSGLDNNNDVITSDGGTRFRLNDAGQARLEIYSGTIGNPGVLENRWDWNDTGATFRQQVGSESYTSGILGAGTVWDTDDAAGVGRTFFEIDNMRVRNALRVHIFKKDIVRASNGFLMITDSAQIVEDKVLADNTAGQTLKIKKGDGNSTFSVGDLLWAKNIDESGGGLTVNGLQATITAIDTNPADYVELTLDTGSGGNGGEVFDGDTIVRVSGPNILNDASSTNAPFLDMYSGVNTWGDFYQNNTGNDKLKVRLGRLDGVTRQGINLSGFGLFSERVRLTEDILIGDFTEDSNYLKFDGSSFTVDADAFSLESTNIYISDSDGGRIEAGGAGTGFRAGITGASSGSGASDSIAFWVGEDFADRTVAPVWIKRGGDFHFGGETSDFIDSIGGVLTADFDDISFSSNTFDLSANGLSITTADGIDVGSDFWHNDSTFSFGGGSLTGTSSDVTLADQFLVSDSGNITGTVGGREIQISQNSNRSFFRVRPDNSTYNNRVDMYHHDDGSWGLEGRVSGNTIFQLGSTNQIAGSYFDATHMWGGSSSKSNASVRLDFENGYIYYDAMTQVVFSQSSTASYGSNQSDSNPIGTSVWEVQSVIVNPSGSATTTKQDSDDTIIIRCPYVHRFGFNHLQFTGFIDWLYTENGSPSIDYNDAIITMTVNGYSESTTISSSVSSFRDVAIDIGSSGANLSEGNIYTVRIKIESRVRGSLDADESMDVKCSVRDDAMILATT